MSAHPLDSQYASLHTTLDPIDRAGHEFTILQRMLANEIEGEMAMWRLELVDAFKVERAVEREAWEADMGGSEKGERRLLWHGAQGECRCLVG